MKKIWWKFIGSIQVYEDKFNQNDNRIVDKSI